MNLERTKPETLAAGVMDYMPQSLAAHEYAERLNAALARLGLTDRLTLPPAPNTAIDELPGVVDVPLRKTLSVLMGKAQQGDASALATLEWTAQVAESIFAGLHARASVYPLALPSHESLATLSQGVDALLPRKISTGWSVASLLADPTCDGIDDGVSLVRLLCDSTIQPTELKDDNIGWTMDKTPTLPSTLTKLVLGCKQMTAPIGDVSSLTLLELPNLEVYHTYQSAMTSGEYKGTTADLRRLKETRNAILPNAPYLTENPFRDIEVIRPDYAAQSMTILGNTAIDTIDLPNLKTVNASCWTCVIMGGSVRVIKCEALESCTSNYNGHTTYSAALIGGDLLELEELWLGKLTGTGYITSNSASKANTPKLIKVVVGEGTNCQLTLNAWSPSAETLANPLFLANFKTYIAERLSEQGSGLTLTLSQAVRDAIEGDPTIAQIITSKGWTISPAPSV